MRWTIKTIQEEGQKYAIQILDIDPLSFAESNFRYITYELLNVM
jgi:hypothetical protein